MNRNEFLKNNKYVGVCDDWCQLVAPPANLNYGEVILLAKIMNMCTDTSDCVATNDTLAGFLCVPNATLRNWLYKLDKTGLIIKYNTSNIDKLGAINIQRHMKVNMNKIKELCPKREESFSATEKNRRRNLKDSSGYDKK